MDYNAIYKKSNSVFGDKPTPIIKLAADIYLLDMKPGNFLDLGAGQGRDSFYMSSLGFKVHAIDNSKSACEQIETTIVKKNIQNIQVENLDIKNLATESNKFDIISAINVIHFVKKNDSIKLIRNIKLSLKTNGLAVISLFIKPNGFCKQELLKIFKDYEIVYYSESSIVDKGHPGQTKEHTHKVSRLIAKKG